MLLRFGWAVVGFLCALALIGAGGYIFLVNGGLSMATSSAPLPLEKAIARLALRASIGNARDTKNPLPLTSATLLAGAPLYRDHCAFCHGAPGHAPDAIASAMFPTPPELFAPKDMVTDDPEGVTYWKVTNGIRLSAMPAFGTILSDAQRWEITALVAHANALPPDVHAALETQQH